MLSSLAISPKVFGPLFVSLGGALALYGQGQTHAAEAAAAAGLAHFILGYFLPAGAATLPTSGGLEQPDLSGLLDDSEFATGNPPTGAQPDQPPAPAEASPEVAS